MTNTAHNLYIEANHLSLSLSPGPWLLDTGSDVSFGRAPVLHVTKEPIHVPASNGAYTVPKIRMATNVPYVGLVGNDILGKFDTLLDLANDNVARFISADITSIAGRKVELGFVTNSKIPIVNAQVGLNEFRMIFDTGAQYSYLSTLEGIETEPAGVATDFVFKNGVAKVFKVELHKVVSSLGGVTAPITFASEPGMRTSPAQVSTLLKATGTNGILGWEILKHGPMAYLPRRSELWI